MPTRKFSLVCITKLITCFLYRYLPKNFGLYCFATAFFFLKRKCSFISLVRRLRRVSGKHFSTFIIVLIKFLLFTNQYFPTVLNREKQSSFQRQFQKSRKWVQNSKGSCSNFATLQWEIFDKLPNLSLPVSSFVKYQKII